ncbi:unnamed protein product [Amoebophrya sp. A25]|nr:unnamed protein product [Amoebophrya sp. A25]|eukprot:GSA25T00012524001.1
MRSGSSSLGLLRQGRAARTIMERYRQIRPAPYDTGKPSPNTRFREQDHAHAIENQTSSENGSSAFRHQGDFLFQTSTEVDVDAKGQSWRHLHLVPEAWCSWRKDERGQPSIRGSRH